MNIWMCILASSVVLSKSYSANITAILDSLKNGYDKRLRPNYGQEPVEVGITMYVSTISAVSEVEMDFTLDLYLRQSWTDPRLRFQGTNESLTIGVEMIKDIWVPDTFFPNEKRSFFHEATAHNSFLRINPSGEILRSLRLTVTAMCPMDLQNFPLDSQKCTLEIESYGYSTRDIAYHWMEGNKSVTISTAVHLAQFTVGDHEISTGEFYLTTGNYSRLYAHFTFRRNVGFYLIQIYLPSSLIVIISWVSFWLNREATQARVSIGVTTVLTMTTLMTSTNASMPKVSYVKSLDVYLGTCFIIVFASLLEFAAVGYLAKRIRMRGERSNSEPMTLRRVTSDPSSELLHQSQSADLSCDVIPSPRPSILLTHPLMEKRQGAAPTSAILSSAGSSFRSGLSPVFDARVFGTVTAAGHRPFGEDCDCETALLSQVKTRSTTHRSAKPRSTHRNNVCKPSSIDKYSRVIFPVSFMFFHLVYWTVYIDAL